MPSACEDVPATFWSEREGLDCNELPATLDKAIISPSVRLVRSIPYTVTIVLKASQLALKKSFLIIELALTSCISI